jgi:hypothetical protein
MVNQLFMEGPFELVINLKTAKVVGTNVPEFNACRRR